MRLARLDLTRYGKFTGGSLDFGARQPGRPDLHIVYGPNEAGKSTAFSAFLDLLFGIETQSGYAFLHSYKTMKIDAALELGGAPPKMFGRIKRPQNSLLDGSDQPVGEGLLHGGLGGLDRTAYRHMFSLDDETLEKGGQSILASKGDLGQLLFSASAGLAELSQTLEELRAEADKFYRGRSKNELSELKARLDRLKSERDHLDTALPAYKKLVDTREASRARYENELAERTGLQSRATAVERLLQTLPHYARLLSLRARLETMGEDPTPPPNWRDELPEMQHQVIEVSTKLGDCEAEIARLASERDGLEVDAAVLGLGERVDDLGRTRDRFTGAEEDLPRRRNALADQDARLARLLVRLGRDEEPDPDRLLLGASVLAGLRDLIAQHSGVVTRLETAHRQHAENRQAVEDAEAALAAAGGHDAEATGRLGSLQVLVTTVRAGDHAVRRRQAERTRKVVCDELDRRLGLLRPWTGSLDELAAGVPPSPATLARWKQADTDLVAASMRHADEMERLESERLRLRAEHEAALQFTGIVSDPVLASARARRTQAWANHRRDLRPETADRFEAALRDDDTATAARLQGGDEVARLRQLGQRLAVVEASLARAVQQRDATVAAQDGLVAEIGAALALLGWPDRAPMPAADVEAWLKGRAECLEAGERMRDEERAIAEADADAREARDRLAAALAAAGVTCRETATFAELLAVAEAVVERETSLSGLRAQLGERRSALLRCERELAAARRGDAGWQAAWAEICQSCWLAEGGAVPTLPAVRAILDVLDELGPVLLQRADLVSRIEKMKADQARYAEEAGRLARELQWEGRHESVLDLSSKLARRLEEARDAERRHVALSARFEDAQGRHAALMQANTVLVRRSAEMTALFGVASLAEVAVRRDEARQRTELMRTVGEIEGEIVVTLGTSTLVEAEAALTSSDRTALEAERDELLPRLTDLDQRLRVLFAEHRQASDAVAAVGADDAVARIAAQRRTILLDTEDKARRHLRLRIGVAAAEQALRAYRDQHRSSMLHRASDAFRTISRSAYSGLAAQPGDKGDVLVALGAGTSKGPDELSKGTRFQLYLALRVAGYYEYCLSREPVPFVADDIMETFDDFRAEEAFRLFAEMGEVGQVIYLTHHRHLCDVARKVCPEVNIIDLPAAA